MRLHISLIVGLSAAVNLGIGCHRDRKEAHAPSHHMRVISEETVPAQKPADSPTTGSTASTAAAAPAPPMKMDAKNNPTAASDRGEPSLDDKDRPAVWVYVDGKSGKFAEQAGQKLLQWMIDDAVSTKPTVRVEAYEPLLGAPKDFKCVLKTVQSNDGSYIDYRIYAKEGTFEVGRDYNLLTPGDNFTIRNAMSDDMVKEIGPLHPGTYAIAASLRNGQTGKESSGVTYFSVAGN